MKQRSMLGEHRSDLTWFCGYCPKVIHGKRNTIHLAIISHVDKEIRDRTRPVSFPFGGNSPNDVLSPSKPQQPEARQ